MRRVIYITDENNKSGTRVLLLRGQPSPEQELSNARSEVMNDLIRHLSEGAHAVEISTPPKRTVQLFKAQLD